MAYQVIDAYGSVITIQSSVFGTEHRQIVGASIIGAVPVTLSNTSIATLQGTNPWLIGNNSVLAFQGTLPWVINSIVGTYAEDAASSNNDKGLMVLGLRNDTVASVVNADLDYTAMAADSAGRTLIRPFAAEEARVEGIAVLTSTSITTMVAAAGTGLKNYITDIWLANTGSVATLVTFKDGLGSILGYTVAPATSGSNLPGLATPIRTGANASFDILAGTATSTLYGTVKGFKAP